MGASLATWVLTASALASEPASTAVPAPSSAQPSAPAPAPPPRPSQGRRRTIVVEPRTPTLSEPDRAGSVVTARDMEERLPRSAPDALKYEPGVYVQQTAHGQASPYIRGLTGQQTVMLFDGVRINTSTFRQGPNQYFFTIDSRAVQAIEVLRGGSSTRYGSDALGGAILARPIEPTMERGARPFTAHGRGLVRTATTDGELGGRVQLDLGYKGRLGVIAGVGYRDVGELRSGGHIRGLDGRIQNVPPLIAADGKTQRGTGFREFTADTRLVWKLRERTRLTLGYYDYRQLDVPRTDRCPPPQAPQDECLRYLRQFRTMVYGALDHGQGPAGAESVRWTVSFQNQHERRQLDRGSPSQTQVNGVDDVDTVGTGLTLTTRTFAPRSWFDLRLLYGLDAYLDWVDSKAWQFYKDTRIVSSLSRGQYLDGGNYLTSGVWTEVQTTFAKIFRVRGGGRGAFVLANAPGEAASSSAPVDRKWFAGVGNAGISLQALHWLALIANVNQGFRAPNLDDLTSRQQIGPGFQFENPDLRPERSVTYEGGVAVRHPVIEIDAWIYQTDITNLIARAFRTAAECPAGDPGCGASRTRFQVVNLDGRSVIRGAEAGLRLYLPHDLLARTTISYAWGEGPNPVPQAAQSPGEGYRQRVPLSRIPPLNGNLDLGWRSSRFGVFAFATLRWATGQDRLAPQDVQDPRIPSGGTPGYTVFDLRAGYRWDPHVLVGVVFENLADTAYRTHGSSVNGPGRGISVHAQLGF